MGNFPLENRFDLGCITSGRSSRHKSANLFGEREIRFVGNGENVRDLGGDDFLGNAVATLESDALRSDGFQAPAVVQAIGFRFPQNSVDVEKVVPEQLFNSVRLGSAAHVGVVLDTPHIKDQSLRTEPALDSSE